MKLCCVRELFTVFNVLPSPYAGLYAYVWTASANQIEQLFLYTLLQNKRLWCGALPDNNF